MCSGFSLQMPLKLSRVRRKKDVLKDFSNFTRKYLCWSLQACNLIKKRLQHRCFPVSTCFYRTHPVAASKKSMILGQHISFSNFETSKETSSSEKLSILTRLKHFFAKFLTHYITDLKHVVVVLLHQAYCLTSIYGWTKSYFPKSEAIMR